MKTQNYHTQDGAIHHGYAHIASLALIDLIAEAKQTKKHHHTTNMSTIDSAQNPTHQRFVRDLVVDSSFAAIGALKSPVTRCSSVTMING